MRIKIHDRDLRGATKRGWLDSKHTFSFGHFYDPQRMGFRALRVINDDIVAPGSGFPTHPHDNMEIITIILKGALEHKDSMGNGSVIKAGEVQKMSAGTGVTHSEFNPSNNDPVHLLQIWIEPAKRDLKPSYQQVAIDGRQEPGRFVLIGDDTGGDDRIQIHQNVRLYVANAMEGDVLNHGFDAGRYGFLHVADGQIEFEGEVLKNGDGVEVSDASIIKARALSDAQLILFDLA